MKRKILGIVAFLLISLGFILVVFPIVSNYIGVQVAHTTVSDFKNNKSAVYGGEKTTDNSNEAEICFNSSVGPDALLSLMWNGQYYYVNLMCNPSDGKYVRSYIDNNLISNAKYVCTDSFHGTVFSILYKRQFMVFNRYTADVNGKSSTNSRLSSLLNLLGLENRLYDSNKGLKQDMFEPINFETAHKNIEKLREQSLAYLKNALSDSRI